MKHEDLREAGASARRAKSPRAGSVTRAIVEVDELPRCRMRAARNVRGNEARRADAPAESREHGAAREIQMLTACPVGGANQSAVCR